MTANRHADAVRAFLDYVCRSPQPAAALAWPEWMRRTTGATAVVGLSFSVVACGGETFSGGGGGGGPGGGPSGGGANIVPVNGGSIGVLYGIVQATGGNRIATGGAIGAGGIGALYGMPIGGIASGGRVTGGAPATGGVLATGGTMYGMIGGTGSGGRPTGGTATGGKAPLTGGAQSLGGMAPLYGLPIGGMGAGGQPAGGARAGGSGGVTGGSMSGLYGIPAGGGATVDAGTVDCSCPISASLPVCGVNGQTYDAACGAPCVPVDIACLGQCPCDVDGGASCNVACTAVASSTYCDSSHVEWVCKSGHPASLMSSAGCQMLATGAIRYCCPTNFLTACH
jgi:hypothetical protein